LEPSRSRLDREIRNRYASVLALGKIDKYLIAAFNWKLACRKNKRQVRPTRVSELFIPKIAATLDSLQHTSIVGTSCLLFGFVFAMRLLWLAQRDKVPDQSWLSKTRSRLPHEVHEKVWLRRTMTAHRRCVPRGNRDEKRATKRVVDFAARWISGTEERGFGASR
jgi:hypothetical protein